MDLRKFRSSCSSRASRTTKSTDFDIYTEYGVSGMLLSAKAVLSAGTICATDILTLHTPRKSLLVDPHHDKWVKWRPEGRLVVVILQ